MRAQSSSHAGLPAVNLDKYQISDPTFRGMQPYYDDNKTFIPIEYIDLDPNEILFSQDSVSNKFRDGWTIQEKVSFIVRNQLPKEPFAPMRVVKKDTGGYITHDNRRLLLYRLLSRMQQIRKCTVCVVATPIPSWQLTTTDGGQEVRIRVYRFKKDPKSTGKKPKTDISRTQSMEDLLSASLPLHPRPPAPPKIRNFPPPPPPKVVLKPALRSNDEPDDKPDDEPDDEPDDWGSLV